jgi:hypothetical protein
MKKRWIIQPILWTEQPTDAVVGAGSLWRLVFTFGKAWGHGLLPYNELATFCKFLKSYKTTPLDYKLIMYINLPKNYPRNLGLPKFHHSQQQVSGARRLPIFWGKGVTNFQNERVHLKVTFSSVDLSRIYPFKCTS